MSELVPTGTRVLRAHDLRESPLWCPDGRHSLSGRIVTDPREVAAIAARIAGHRRGWWRWSR